MKRGYPAVKWGFRACLLGLFLLNCVCTNVHHSVLSIFNELQHGFSVSLSGMEKLYHKGNPGQKYKSMQKVCIRTSVSEITLVCSTSLLPGKAWASTTTEDPAYSITANCS